MQIIKEEVLGTRGSFVIKARVVIYNSGSLRNRRAELLLEKMGNGPQDEVGWTIEELAELHNSLVKWKEKPDVKNLL